MPTDREPAAAAVGRHCSKCGRRVFWVQNANGERFVVDHSGRRWCPNG